jgi:cell division inhibitor SepF
MSLWKRTMDYLGLGPDDAYDDYDVYEEPEAEHRPSRAPREPDQRSQRGWEPESEPAVQTVSPRPSFPSRDFESSGPRRAPGGTNGRSDDSGVQVRPAPSSTPQPAPQPSLRSVPGGSMEPHTVRPRRFDQAQEVADKFKEGQPVIMNLEGTDRSIARRLIDFASGICYALDGSMEKVATGVYLLKPRTPQQQRYEDYAE